MASSDEWATPKWIVETVAEPLNGFDLDPASGAEEEPHAETIYTKSDNGLEQDWFGYVWLNPPYSDPGPWLEKAEAEVNEGRAECVVALVKGDTSTYWYQRYGLRADVTCFMRSRVQFEGAEYDAPWPCHILVYTQGENREEWPQPVRDMCIHLHEQLGNIRLLGF